jgi:hypothetical protein
VASWAALLAESLAAIGYQPTETNRNVWIKPSVKLNGYRYRQIILVYVYDILHVSHDPNLGIEALKKLHVFKEDSVDPPKKKCYLGANIKNVQVSGNLKYGQCLVRVMHMLI